MYIRGYIILYMSKLDDARGLNNVWHDGENTFVYVIG